MMQLNGRFHYMPLFFLVRAKAHAVAYATIRLVAGCKSDGKLVAHAPRDLEKSITLQHTTLTIKNS